MKIKKYLEKIEQQKKKNPGNKETYVQPLRPRSTVFKSKVTYDRKREKKNIQKGNYDE